MGETGSEDPPQYQRHRGVSRDGLVEHEDWGGTGGRSFVYTAGPYSCGMEIEEHRIVTGGGEG